MAGLAAIGQAKCMGAIVRAFDTRSIVKEQVESLGAEFLTITIEVSWFEVSLKLPHGPVLARQSRFSVDCPVSSRFLKVSCFFTRNI